MAELQRAGERKHQRDVLGLGRLLAHRLDVGRGACGKTAGERRVGVDVELEQVKEWVGDHRDGAVLLSLDAVVELEGLVGLLAGGEGDPFDLVVFWVLDMLARFPMVKMEAVRIGLPCIASCHMPRAQCVFNLRCARARSSSVQG